MKRKFRRRRCGQVEPRWPAVEARKPLRKIMLPHINPQNTGETHMNPRQTHETPPSKGQLRILNRLSVGINTLKTLFSLAQEPQCIKEWDVTVPSLPEDQDGVSIGDEIENDRPDSFIVNAASYTGTLCRRNASGGCPTTRSPFSHDLLGYNSANGTKHHPRGLYAS